jgi:hypothetical protein
MYQMTTKWSTGYKIHLMTITCFKSQ